MFVDLTVLFLFFFLFCFIFCFLFFFFVLFCFFCFYFFFFQAEDGIRDVAVTGVQTCALPIHTNPTNYPRLLKISEQLSQSDMIWRYRYTIAHVELNKIKLLAVVDCIPQPSDQY